GEKPDVIFLKKEKYYIRCSFSYKFITVLVEFKQPVEVFINHPLTRGSTTIFRTCAGLLYIVITI
ncbi:MAG: hypothetical protein ACYDG2_27025, partial [Ruminiclostridium sp.]